MQVILPGLKVPLLLIILKILPIRIQEIYAKGQTMIADVHFFLHI